MKAIVLFSGGLDSSTCLALAVNEHGAVKCPHCGEEFEV